MSSGRIPLESWRPLSNKLTTAYDFIGLLSIDSVIAQIASASGSGVFSVTELLGARLEDGRQSPEHGRVAPNQRSFMENGGDDTSAFSSVLPLGSWPALASDTGLSWPCYYCGANTTRRWRVQHNRAGNGFL